MALAAGDLRGLVEDGYLSALLEVVIEPGDPDGRGAWCIDVLPDEGDQRYGTYCSHDARLLVRPSP
jgi:hypothetical protein